MEFKNVYVINCVEETIPNASSIKENIEELKEEKITGQIYENIDLLFFMNFYKPDMNNSNEFILIRCN